MSRYLLLFFLALIGLSALGGEAPPRNPFLADSSYPMAHGEPAQQDSVPQAGPRGPTTTLRSDQVDYRHLGPGHFGANLSGVYPDGARVFWSNGLDRIVKMDQDTFDVIDEYFFPGAEVYSSEEADEAIAAFDASNDGIFAIWRGFRQMLKLRDLANLYTLLDRNHHYFIGSRHGAIRVYGDEDPADSRSRIIKLNETRLPPEVTGPVMGLNITFDGRLVVVTEHGYVALMGRDFSGLSYTRLLHSEGAEKKETGPAGRGWVRNPPALDQDGGIYIVSQAHMHKVVRTGSELSTREADGAWVVPYRNGWGHGSGATPSLMGFGDNDRFVVITDGEPRMNVVLYWRDAIPENWEALPGQPRRVAGIREVTMGDPELTEIQSEQSVVVSGYGAMVVNNEPGNFPWYLPGRAKGILVGLLGSNPRYQPYGVQKFIWKPESRSFEVAWINRSVSSPSSVPIVSRGADRVYLIGARNNRFTLEALDWTSGESRFHYVIGGQRYNVMYAGTLLDEAGRINYGTPWGRVRINYLGER